MGMAGAECEGHQLDDAKMGRGSLTGGEGNSRCLVAARSKRKKSDRLLSIRSLISFSAQYLF